MEKRIYLTKQGLSEAQAELNYLTKTRVPELAQSLKDARSSEITLENWDWYSLRNEQILIEKRITRLRDLVRNATIIEDSGTDKVSVGTKTKLKFLADDRIETYYIVGTYEANPFEHKISDRSPIVRAILGKEVNDTVTVTLKSSEFQVKIMGIS